MEFRGILENKMPQEVFYGRTARQNTETSIQPHRQTHTTSRSSMVSTAQRFIALFHKFDNISDYNMYDGVYWQTPVPQHNSTIAMSASRRSAIAKICLCIANQAR